MMVSKINCVRCISILGFQNFNINSKKIYKEYMELKYIYLILLKVYIFFIIIRVIIWNISSTLVVAYVNISFFRQMKKYYITLYYTE